MKNTVLHKIRLHLRLPYCSDGDDLKRQSFWNASKVRDILSSAAYLYLVSNLFLPLGSLVYLLFCVTKYGWGWDNYKKEVNIGKGLKMHDWMRGYLTYVLPVIVLFIFAFGIYDKFFA